MKKAQSKKQTAWSSAIRSAFGSRMRALRRQLRVSQEELGWRCGLDPSFVGQVERGERNLSLESIYRIANGLETLPANLLVPLEAGLRPEGKSDGDRSAARAGAGPLGADAPLSS